MTLNPADEAFADRLRAALPDDVIRPVAARYLEEPRAQFQGVPGVLALPRDTGQVSRLVALAHDAHVPVVPYGGGTGLVGGQVLPDGPAPLIVSLERMNAIRHVWPRENVLEAEAGVILADVQAAAADVDRLFPLSLAAEGSARIGGNLATNAGGVNVLRYGSARAQCLGLEAVLPDGRVWNGLSRLRKDNTGYDLRDLLIGAEGTLGIITAASLRLMPRPAASGTAYLVVPHPAAALDLLALAQQHLGETISAFELIHRTGFDFLSQTLPQVRQPFATPPEWCVLIDIGLAAGLDPADQLTQLFGAASEQDLVTDGLIAQSEAQRTAFWSVREHLPEANRLIGAISSHDMSLPLAVVADFIARAPGVIASLGHFRTNCFGHLGDGNLHYNVFPPPGGVRTDHLADSAPIKRALHDLVHELGGSVSAEHGIGRLKTSDLQRYGDPAKLAMMQAIKSAFDPRGIMNPGAILPL